MLLQVMRMRIGHNMKNLTIWLGICSTTFGCGTNAMNDKNRDSTAVEQSDKLVLNEPILSQERMLIEEFGSAGFRVHGQEFNADQLIDYLKGLEIEETVVFEAQTKAGSLKRPKVIEYLGTRNISWVINSVSSFDDAFAREMLEELNAKEHGESSQLSDSGLGLAPNENER